ncbi:methyltransferase domain-containing protein [Saccharomonospora azurea]|uniref:methyltransferase domain-containing protein n=1 Tax=Saccharomonospora azurea TaxID=40988 RepID=UPI0033327B4B
MDPSAVAVPHTLAHLEPLLPTPPARVLEVGCGRGALAAALADLGYKVTGVDRNAEMAAAATRAWTAS